MNSTKTLVVIVIIGMCCSPTMQAIDKKKLAAGVIAACSLGAYPVMTHPEVASLVNEGVRDFAEGFFACAPIPFGAGAGWFLGSKINDLYAAPALVTGGLAGAGSIYAAGGTIAADKTEIDQATKPLGCVASAVTAVGVFVPLNQ